MNNKKTFKALMAYLNPIGSIGTNVDMFTDEIEFFPAEWSSKKTFNFRPIDLFMDFIYKLLNKNGQALFDRTDKQDTTYWVDVTINPRKREIILTPKYFVYNESKYNTTFDWRNLEQYYFLSKFMEDRNTDELIIDYSGFEGNFDCTLTYNNKELKNPEVYYLSRSIKQIIGDILKTDNWNSEAGGHGVMKLYDENNAGYLYHRWTEKNVEKGKPLILNEEDFN